MTIPCQSFRLKVQLPHLGPHIDTARIAARETSEYIEGSVLLPGSPIGIVIFVAASGAAKLGSRGNAADRMHQQHLATVEIDLLNEQAAHFADAATHLPLLTERLLAVITQLTRMMDSDVIPSLSIGLYASGDATPMAIRAAAIRDSAVGALACVGGLIDLAGRQYLHELEAPLLMLFDRDDSTAAANLNRARLHMPGQISVESLPDDAEGKDNAVAALATAWFASHLPT